MTLAAGARLGPHEIQTALGAGGMGEVYRARDTRLDRIVAIKILPAQLAGNPHFRERFDREARAISALDHPHICALYDVGEHEGTAYLAMGHDSFMSLTGDCTCERLTSLTPRQSAEPRKEERPVMPGARSSLPMGNGLDSGRVDN